jgi:hypothetical protein
LQSTAPSLKNIKRELPRFPCAHGWRLHVLRLEDAKQVLHIGAAAGAVRTQRWRSASARGRNDAQARAHRGNWPGGPAHSKPAWPRAGFKMELDRTEQWAGPGKSFSIFKVFPNCIQLIRASKIQKGNFQGFTNFQTLVASR